MGSAIGEQAFAMLMAKEDEKVTATIVIAAKKYQTKEKKARGTTVLFTAASEITKRLEQLGLSA